MDSNEDQEKNLLGNENGDKFDYEYSVPKEAIGFNSA